MAKTDSFAQFIDDIRPMFFRANLTYVDVGAYDGAMLDALVESGLSIGEAHLIEPNPDSFALLETRTGPHKEKRAVHLYRAAAGNSETKLLFKSARKMTSVMSEASKASVSQKADKSTFTAKALTLDSLRPLIRGEHVSLLKIDVEGYEDRVLEGAKGLLGDQAADIIHIEAGADPASRQQVYYRRIEDILNRHGYRLFRIYEQMHEWTEDSPFLRRMNLAFISPRFAERNPFKLTRELFKLKQRVEADQAKLETGAIELQGLRQALEEARALAPSGSLSEWSGRLEALQGERDGLAARVSEAEARLTDVESALSEAREARDEADAKVKRLRKARDQALAAAAELEAARTNDQEEAATALQHLRDELKASETRRRHEHTRLIAERDTAQARAAEASAVLVQARAKIESALADRVALDQVRTELEVARSERNLAQSVADFERSRVEAEADQRSAIAKRLRDEIDRQTEILKAKTDAIAVLEGQLHDALKTTETDRVALNARISTLNRQLADSITAARAEVGRLGTELSASRQESARLADDLQAERDAHAATRDRGSAAEADMMSKARHHWEKRRVVTGRLEREQRRRTELEEKLIAARRRNEALQRKLDRANRIIAKETLTRQSSEADLRRLRGTLLGGAAGGLQSLRRDLARRTRSLRGLKSERPSTAALAAASSAAGSSPAKTDKRAPKTRASRVEARLWGGFSAPALAELKKISADSTVTAAERADADWALASWFAAEGQHHEALAPLARLRAAEGSIRLDLLETHVLAHLGRACEMRAGLSARLETNPDDPTLSLALANTYVTSTNSEALTESDVRLAAINRAYAVAGLAPLIRIDSARPVVAGNLRTDPGHATPVDGGPRVSVIVPAYQAESSIDMTLDGLIEQTWRNLEIIVVDDCSLDGTADKVATRARLDPRIRLLRQEVNQGSYSCRNLALGVATGDFITVHDAGDWSHAQKIERQVRHLQANPGVIANHSKWARAFENLLFLGKFRRKEKLIDWNPSSLMFRRELLDLVGGWDRVRISADAEFVRRAKAAAAPRGLVAIPEAAPLAFGFDTPASLTKHSATHGRTITHGFRREYHEAANAWHAQADRAALKLSLDRKARAFPAPGPILADRRDETAVDLLVLGPLSETDLSSAVAERLDAVVSTGVRVGLFNWRRYEADVSKPVTAALRRLSREREVPILAPGETVRARVALVLSADVLDKPVDLFPATRIDEVVVIGETGTARAQALAAALLGDRGRWLEEDAAWTRATDAARGIGEEVKAKRKSKPKTAT